MSAPASSDDWARAPERGSPWLMRLMFRVATWAGRGPASLLLAPIATYFWLRTPQSRRASRRYLERLWGHPVGWHHTLRHYRVFSQTILDRVYLLSGRDRGFDLRVFGEPVMLEAMKRGKGAFLVGAHLGSFEVLRLFGRRQPGLRVSLAMYEDNARKIGGLLRSIDPSLEMDVLALGRVDSMIEVQQRLDRGDFVGFLADRSFTSDGAIEVPFLGKPAPFPSGAFRMAAVLRRPVLMMAGLYRGGNRYDVFFDQLVDFSDVSRGERAVRVDAAIAAYAARLEEHCRAEPYNWFNFYDFWAETPHQEDAAHAVPRAAGESDAG